LTPPIGLTSPDANEKLAETFGIGP
jgi:hypothetical protein